MKFVIIIAIVFVLFIPPTVFAQYYTTSLVLDPISPNVKLGDTITFSGQLITGEYVVTEATIYIKDDVDFGVDTLFRLPGVMLNVLKAVWVGLLAVIIF